MVRLTIAVVDEGTAGLVTIGGASVTILRARTQEQPLMFDDYQDGNAVSNPLSSDIHGSCVVWLGEDEVTVVDCYVTDSNGQAHLAGHPQSFVAFSPYVQRITASGGEDVNEIIEPADTTRIEFTRIAARALSGHRVVSPLTNGRVDYATVADLADVTKPMWLTTTAAGANTPVTCVALGEVTEPSWAWAAGPVFLGLDGALTQVAPAVPVALFQMVVGYPSKIATALFFNPRSPLILAT